MDCPKNYIPIGDLPIACQDFCPLRNLRRADWGKVPDRFYTAITAHTNPLSPIFQRYKSKNAVNMAAFAREQIMTVSQNPENPKEQGRGNRRVPHCGLVAYVALQEARAENHRQVKKLAASRQERMQEGNDLRGIKPTNLERFIAQREQWNEEQRLDRLDKSRIVQEMIANALGKNKVVEAIDK